MPPGRLASGNFGSAVTLRLPKRDQLARVVLTEELRLLAGRGEAEEPLRGPGLTLTRTGR
jgi:hypothetical protein